MRSIWSHTELVCQSKFKMMNSLFYGKTNVSQGGQTKEETQQDCPEEVATEVTILSCHYGSLSRGRPPQQQPVDPQKNSPCQLLTVPRQSLASRDTLVKPEKAQVVTSTPMALDPTPNANPSAAYHHQRCESGSTGYAFPEPADSDKNGVPRPHQSFPTQAETALAAPQAKPKKKVQFFDEATEPDQSEDGSSGAEVSSEQEECVSREDTMVEHSVVLNDEAPLQEATDYLQALQSAMLDVSSDANAADSGKILARKEDVLQNNYVGFNAEDDQMIEKTLLEMRDRIRSGKALSHQVQLEIEAQERDEESDSDKESYDSCFKINQNGPTFIQESENVQSSGMANIRLNRLPLGNHARVESTVPCPRNLIMGSKATEVGNDSVKLASQSNDLQAPAGILKVPKQFSREPSLNSVEAGAKAASRSLRQHVLPAERRHEARTQQSVTYSPVSHCVTRDAQNIFEKKKQRMAKIQGLRGVSNQSDTGLDRHKYKDILQVSGLVDLESKAVQKEVQLEQPGAKKKQPVSLPQTPRDSFLSQIVLKQSMAKQAPPELLRDGNTAKESSNFKKPLRSPAMKEKETRTVIRPDQSNGAGLNLGVALSDAAQKHSLKQYQSQDRGNNQAKKFGDPEPPLARKQRSREQMGQLNSAAHRPMFSHQQRLKAVSTGAVGVQEVGKASRKQQNARTQTAGTQASDRTKSDLQSLIYSGQEAVSLPSQKQHQLEHAMLRKILALDQNQPSISQPKNNTKTVKRKEVQIQPSNSAQASKNKQKKRVSSRPSNQRAVSNFNLIGFESAKVCKPTKTRDSLSSQRTGKAQPSRDTLPPSSNNKRGLNNRELRQLMNTLMAAQGQSPQKTSVLHKEQVLFLFEQFLALANPQADLATQPGSQQASRQIMAQVQTKDKVSGVPASEPDRESPRNEGEPTQLHYRHQKCESGSTGFSFPEPADSDQNGLPRPRKKARGRLETQVVDLDSPSLISVKPSKKVHFRNVATEPDQLPSEASSLDHEESISREDTMVEHSVVADEETPSEEPTDYLQALKSVKLEVSNKVGANHISGECSIEQQYSATKSNPSTSYFGGFTSQQETLIEQTLLQIRDRIRSGLPLSHQIARDSQFQNIHLDNNNEASVDGDSQKSQTMIVTENQYSPNEESENVQSSGMANFRLTCLPLGTQQRQETSDSSVRNLILSSKASNLDNNLSKKELFALNAKATPQSTDLQAPAGILKVPKQFSREPSLNSVEAGAKAASRSLRQHVLPAERRHEARTQQSMTYSPVSHCVTRDAQNIFEKKKQRMAKIQGLRGVSNQSEPTQPNDNQAQTQITHQCPDPDQQLKLTQGVEEEPSKQIADKKRVVKQKRLSQNHTGMSLATSTRKEPHTKKKIPQSQPITPRKFCIQNVLHKLASESTNAKVALKEAADLEKRRDSSLQSMQVAYKLLGPASKLISKAPPVSASNTHALNSVSKKKRGIRTSKANASLTSASCSASKPRVCSSGTRNLLPNNGSSQEASLLQQNLVFFLINPSHSLASIDAKAAPVDSKSKQPTRASAKSQSGMKGLSSWLKFDSRADFNVMEQSGELSLVKLKQHKHAASKLSTKGKQAFASEPSAAYSQASKLLNETAKSMQIDLTQRAPGGGATQGHARANNAPPASLNAPKRGPQPRMNTNLMANKRTGVMQPNKKRTLQTSSSGVEPSWLVSSQKDLFKFQPGQNQVGQLSLADAASLLPTKTLSLASNSKVRQAAIHQQSLSINVQQMKPKAQRYTSGASHSNAIQILSQAKKQIRRQNQTCDGQSLNDLSQVLVSNLMAASKKARQVKPHAVRQSPKHSKMRSQFASNQPSEYFTERTLQHLLHQNAPLQTRGTHHRHQAVSSSNYKTSPISVTSQQAKN